MSPRLLVTAVVTALAAVAVLGSASLPADEPGLPQDMKAVIALQGQPCDKVVNVKRNGDSDYLVSCQDGNRYRVFVDAKGRAVVQKQ
jgi:hypothetical protein